MLGSISEDWEKTSLEGGESVSSLFWFWDSFRVQRLLSSSHLICQDVDFRRGLLTPPPYTTHLDLFDIPK